MLSLLLVIGVTLLVLGFRHVLCLASVLVLWLVVLLVCVAWV